MPLSDEDREAVSAVRRRIRSCTRCKLHTECSVPVPYRGPIDTFVAIIGEAPGRVEDEEGRPFIGPSGQLLDENLRRAGLNPDEIFITNTVRCWPSATKNPKPEHVEACKPNLLLELALAQPTYILLLGAVALSVFLPGESIMKIHGQPFSASWDDTTETVTRHLGLLGQIVFFPTYHPSAVLRNRALTKSWRDDLTEFARLVAEASA